MGLFGGLFQKIGQIMGGKAIDDAFFDELEEQMILADIGAATAMKLVEEARAWAKKTKAQSIDEVASHLEEIICQWLSEGEHQLQVVPGQLNVVLFLGVNGVGKTTTIGKLAYQLKGQGLKVMAAAADTFRAAAIDQLAVWCQRAGIDLIRHQEGADPASVVFDALSAARSRNIEVLLVDTAGRLQNKSHLMEELKKLHRIIGRDCPGQPVESLLVLDATTGQNALSQARLFQEVAGVTGVVLTKLDGTAKGGIVLGIQKEQGLPVKYTGWGETIESLQSFDPQAFTARLFAKEDKEEV